MDMLILSLITILYLFYLQSLLLRYFKSKYIPAVLFTLCIAAAVVYAYRYLFCHPICYGKKTSPPTECPHL